MRSGSMGHASLKGDSKHTLVTPGFSKKVRPASRVMAEENTFSMALSSTQVSRRRLSYPRRSASSLTKTSTREARSRLSQTIAKRCSVAGLTPYSHVMRAYSGSMASPRAKAAMSRPSSSTR